MPPVSSLEISRARFKSSSTSPKDEDLFILFEVALAVIFPAGGCKFGLLRCRLGLGGAPPDIGLLDGDCVG